MTDTTNNWLKELDKAATPGRWMHFVSGEDPDEKLGWRSMMNEQGTIAALRVIGVGNAEAMSVGRDALPVLVAALRALKTRLGEDGHLRMTASHAECEAVADVLAQADELQKAHMTEPVGAEPSGEADLS